MIDWLLRLSLRHRVLVLALALVLFVLGLFRATQMPIDVFPDLTAPRVTVVTEATGMAPEEIERLITFPIETAVNGVSGVRRVRSASAAGISVVWVEFDWDTEDVLARQRVTERLQGLESLPPEAAPPLLAPPSSVMGEIAFVALTGAQQDPKELRRVAEVEVRRRLLAVEGVSQVVVTGGLERQFQVLLDPDALERHNLTAQDVVAAVRAGNRNVPGGFVVEQGQESVVRVLGRAHDETDLAQIVVKLADGVPIRVGQVADVRLGAAFARGTGSYRGESAVVLSIIKQPGADTLATTASIDAAIDALAPALSERGILLHRDLFRQADFITTALDNLMRVLRDGAVLVVVVLWLFLWSWRPTVISVIALPMSILLAVLALEVLGFRLDTMTLGGLAIAMGELVDDAIVDVENVARRLRERSALPEAERPPVLVTVYQGSSEIRSSIVSATAILMLVFVPLLFLGGFEGRLLRPLAVAYLVAIAASLVVAITVTPVLCARLLPNARHRDDRLHPPAIELLGRIYAPVLARAIAHPRVVAVAAGIFVAAGCAALLFVGRSFLPTFNEGSLTIGATTLPGTSLAQSDHLGRLAEQVLLRDPGVESTSRRTGRAERDEHVQSVERSELEVRLRDDDTRTKDELFEDIRQRLATVPGLQFEIGQPISHRIEHMISGQRTALAIKVIGNDLRALRKVANDIEDAIRDVPGLVDLAVEPIVEVPQVVVDIDDVSASRYGLSRGEAAALAGLVLWGEEAGQIYDLGLATEIVVRYPDEVRESLQAVERTRVPTPLGAVVPLSGIADIRRGVGPNVIMRENVVRRVVVTANVAGRDVVGVYEDLRAEIDEQIELPEGVHVDYAGQFEQAEEATMRLLVLGSLSVVGILVIVAVTLQSVRRAIIVLVNIPLALAGGVVGVYLGGGILSVASIIGFITLFGIATRNGILLATRTHDLEQQGLERTLAVTQSARERLAPILMTAVTAGLGLLPLALALGQPGSEIQAPMALVILTGLATSTLLNMIVVPAFIHRWG